MTLWERCFRRKTSETLVHEFLAYSAISAHANNNTSMIQRLWEQNKTKMKILRFDPSL